MRRHKINWNNLRKMRAARKLNLAVKFARSAIEKGVDTREAMRVARGLYHVRQNNLYAAVMKLAMRCRRYEY